MGKNLVGKKINVICLQHVSSREKERKVGYFCYKYSVVETNFKSSFYLSLFIFVPNLEAPQFFLCILTYEFCFKQLCFILFSERWAGQHLVGDDPAPGFSFVSSALKDWYY